MGHRINHVHLKSPDPKKTADGYVKAFDFQIALELVEARRIAGGSGGCC